MTTKERDRELRGMARVAAEQNAMWVCPDCDIAGCRHWRSRNQGIQQRGRDEQLMILRQIAAMQPCRKRPVSRNDMIALYAVRMAKDALR